MNRPLVSVIVPTYNAATTVHSCLDSLATQTMNELEIISVDAGSDDGTERILNEYAAANSHIHLLQSERRSYGHQMNLGIHAASGKYIGIVEADDTVETDMYRTLCVAAEASGADMIRADYYAISQRNGYKKRWVSIINDEFFYDRKVSLTEKPGILTSDTFAIWSGIYRRDFINENNIRFNETAGASFQDLGFWAQTCYWAAQALFLKKALYCYRVDNPASSTFQRDKMFCICSEMESLYDKFDEDTWQSRKALLNRICWILYRKYKRNIERVPEEKTEEYYRRFSEDFDKWRRKFGIEYTDFFEEEKRELEEILSDPMVYLHRLNETREAFLVSLERCDDVLIYGAGRVGKKFLHRLGSKVISFLTTGELEVSSIENTPVASIAETADKYRNLPLIIASKRSDYRMSMLETARKLKYKDIRLIPYGAFEW